MNASAIVGILNLVDSLFNWLTNRGIARDRVLALLQAANDDGGRDVTTEEVQVELDSLQAELDETQDMIDNM